MGWKVSNDKQEFKFEGFVPANTTPVPDVLFDRLLGQLTGAELKVLLYIIRRTWGFKKDTDAISLTQFQCGITTKDGRQLDEGCGIKDRKTITTALNSLEKDGFIIRERTTNEGGDSGVTVYRIRFRSQDVGVKTNHPYKKGSGETQPPSTKGVGAKSNQGRGKNQPGVGAKSNPQETVVQQTVKQQTAKGEKGKHSQPPTPVASTPPDAPIKTFFESLTQEHFKTHESISMPKPGTPEHALYLDLVERAKAAPEQVEAEMRRVYLSLYNKQDTNGEYWWQDQNRLTFCAYLRNYNKQLAALDKPARTSTPKQTVGTLHRASNGFLTPEEIRKLATMTPEQRRAEAKAKREARLAQQQQEQQNV
jgi:hypothetical protein